MSDMISIVEATGQQSWQTAANIGGHTESLTFRISGGTFDDGAVEKIISPVSDSIYDLSVTADIAVKSGATQPVLVYFQDGDLWILVKEASRIFIRPKAKELDYRLLSKGFDALPMGASLASSYNGLVLGGGVRIPTVEAMQTSPVKSIAQMESTIFNPSLPISFVYDRESKVLYGLSTSKTVAATKIYFALLDVDLAGYKVSYANGTRTVVLFHTDGRVETYNNSMARVGEVTLAFQPVRVVCRRANVGTNTADTYVAFTRDGKAHYLNAAFSETSVRSDKFYVNASDSYDVLLTLDGTLVGNSVSNSADIFWYQFVPSSFLVFGYSQTTKKIHQFNIRDNVMYVAGRDLLVDDLVVYNSTAAWTEVGGKIVSGMDTNGSDALFSFADGDVPSQTRAGWSYAELLTAPYTAADTYDRLFYYASRPTSNLKHLSIRDYSVNLPDLSKVDLGPSVTFSVVVSAHDADLPLPITAPAGVAVSAKVDGKEVAYVYNGDEVVITLTHPYITSSTFPVSIGQSVYTFEMQTDSTPDVFTFENILGSSSGTWNRTEDVTISGINVAVPVSVLLNGQEKYDNVKIFIDDVETPHPAYIRRGQTLGFELFHETTTTRVTVTAGGTSSIFGIYTVPEHQLDVGRHWAYWPKGKEIKSDVMVNSGTVPISLTITSTDAQFAQGGQSLVLLTGQSTRIIFTPEENEQYSIKFHSDQYDYEWNVWSDNTWLGDAPAQVRSERYVLADSDDIFFGNIPEGFWTYLKIPAGLLLDVDGVRVDLPLDSRGVYANQDQTIGPFECADTMLKIYGLPSRNQSHSITLGDASLDWSHEFTVDPSYEVRSSSYVHVRECLYLAPNLIKTFVPVLYSAPKFLQLSVERVTDFGHTVAGEFVERKARTLIFKHNSFIQYTKMDAVGNCAVRTAPMTFTTEQYTPQQFPYDIQAAMDIQSVYFDLPGVSSVQDIAQDNFELPEFYAVRTSMPKHIDLPEFYAVRTSMPKHIDLPEFNVVQDMRVCLDSLPDFDSVVDSCLVEAQPVVLEDAPALIKSVFDLPELIIGDVGVPVVSQILSVESHKVSPQYVTTIASELGAKESIQYVHTIDPELGAKESIQYVHTIDPELGAKESIHYVGSISKHIVGDRVFPAYYEREFIIAQTEQAETVQFDLPKPRYQRDTIGYPIAAAPHSLIRRASSLAMPAADPRLIDAQVNPIDALSYRFLPALNLLLPMALDHRHILPSIVAVPKLDFRLGWRSSEYSVPASGYKLDKIGASYSVDAADVRYVKQFTRNILSNTGLYAPTQKTYGIVSAQVFYVHTAKSYSSLNAYSRYVPSAVTGRIELPVGAFVQESPVIRSIVNETRYTAAARSSMSAAVTPEFKVSVVSYPVESAKFNKVKYVPTISMVSQPPRNVVARNSIPVAMFAANKRPTGTASIVAVVPRRVTSSKSYRQKLPTAFAPVVLVDNGYANNPLKEGYFATELDALQNATQVWGFAPSMVYAIRQVNGYWTWAQVTVCEETCGSMSCSARGYLGGG